MKQMAFFQGYVEIATVMWYDSFCISIYPLTASAQMLMIRIGNSARPGFRSLCRKREDEKRE